ncbi:MAG: hypothetical protein VB122_06125 [Erysipelotrichales bacterium]|nr:hypothetical protein [Erysipelotrichales bacterium]
MKIDKVLLIDDNYSDVDKLIFALSEMGISVDYKKDALVREVKICEYTQIVILDLFIGEGVTSFNNAVETVMFLSENIVGPYFIFIWSKHISEFEIFLTEIDLLVENEKLKNYPLKIVNMCNTKLSQQTENAETSSIIKEILKNIKALENEYSNIFSFIEVTTLFREKSTAIWNLLSEYQDSYKMLKVSDYSSYKEMQVANLLSTLDSDFKYEKSGKGLVLLQSKLLENSLTISPVNYSYSKNSNQSTINSITYAINSKLLINKIIQNNYFTNEKKPGMIRKIYEVKKINEIMNDFFKPANLNQEVIFLLGDLYVTPFCDYANNKRKNIILLPVVIIFTDNDLKSFKKYLTSPAVEIKQIKWKHIKDNKVELEKIADEELMDCDTNVYICFKPNTVYTEETKDVKRHHYNFYISKDMVNEIQQSVSNNLNRMGMLLMNIPK